MTWTDAVGMAGVLCVLATYALLQAGRMSAETRLYAGLNALGAGLILVSLVYDFNLASAVIEGAWLAISLFGVWRHWPSAKSGERES